MNESGLEKSVVSQRQSCAVCAQTSLESILDLPNLPLTGRFSQMPCNAIPPGIDQKLLTCQSCGHAQLESQVNPEILYDDSYLFRTSQSPKACAGTDLFLNFLKEVNPKETYDCVLDVGCNDAVMLKKLIDRSRLRIGIDPVGKQKAQKEQEAQATIITDYVETADLSKSIQGQLDCVLLRHTLEHILNPEEVLCKLLGLATQETVFVVEVPCWDTLCEQIRFDQVFHQHLHYFSKASLLFLIHQLGCEMIGHSFNRHDWGTILVAFQKKSRSENKAIDWTPIKRETIEQRIEIFRQHMAGLSEILNHLQGKDLYGYGAANMLPVLAYHLQSDLSCLKAVLDDDSAKDGLFYGNLPLSVMNSQKVRLEDISVMVTAVDNMQPIMGKLLKNRPRDIISPLIVI